MPKLTTTSYAVLGLLSLRSWTSYELTQQVHRSLGRFWPRAKSKLYEEPKKLVAHGLASKTEETIGQRRRSRYTITDAGRRELRAWLGRPSAPPALESEHLLKIFLGDQGGKGELLTTLADMQSWAEKRMADDAGIARIYLDGKGPFSNRMAILTIMGRYSSDFAFMTQQWAQWAQELISKWPDDLEGADTDWEALRLLSKRD